MDCRDSKITKDTLIPLGLLIVLSGVVWGISADRTRVFMRIEQSEKRIQVIEDKINIVVDGVHRLEMKLGTTPVVRSKVAGGGEEG